MVPSGIKVPVASELVFEHGALFLSVEPVIDFDRRKSGAGDPQERDKATGLRLWEVKVTDLDPKAGKFGTTEVKVKIASEYQPEVPEAQVPGFPPKVDFTDVVLVPWVDDRKCRPMEGRAHRCGARQGWSIKASGMVAFGSVSSKKKS